MIQQRTPAEIRALCYRTLGVLPSDVVTFPRLAPHLRAIGGKSKALEYLRASSLPSARRFISIYDDIVLPSVVRKTLPMEAFCIAAKVTAEELLYAISKSARELKQYEGSMKAAELHPAIVSKSSELALEGDVGHATLNMKHMGFLPLPKGSQVSVNVNASANAASQSQSATVLAPSPENTIRRLVNRFNLPQQQPQEALPAPTESPMEFTSTERVAEVVDADYGDED